MVSNELFEEFCEWQKDNKLLSVAYEGLTGFQADLKDFERFQTHKATQEAQKQDPYRPTDIFSIARRVEEINQTRSRR